MVSLQVSDYINWWDENKEKGLEYVKETFLALFRKTIFLSSIYHSFLYKYLNNDQMKHWDAMTFSKNKIEELESSLGKEVMCSTLLSDFHLLVYTYESVLEYEERIILMDKFKGSEELKAKTFSINIYNDLLNITFSNILKLFIEFQSVIEDKNLFKKNLTPQIECLSKRGFQAITDLADSNIRNAISQVGVKANGTKMIFTYRKGAQTLIQESTVYEFKDSLLLLYDGVSAMILAWISCLCEGKITYNKVYQNPIVHEDMSLFFEKLSISTLSTTCNKLYQLDINIETGERQHVNFEFIGADIRY